MFGDGVLDGGIWIRGGYGVLGVGDGVLGGWGGDGVLGGWGSGGGGLGNVCIMGGGEGGLLGMKFVNKFLVCWNGWIKVEFWDGMVDGIWGFDFFCFMG